MELKFLLSRKPVDPEGIYVGRSPQKCILEITLNLTLLGLDFHMRSGSMWASTHVLCACLCVGMHIHVYDCVNVCMDVCAHVCASCMGMVDEERWLSVGMESMDKE